MDDKEKHCIVLLPSIGIAYFFKIESVYEQSDFLMDNLHFISIDVQMGKIGSEDVVYNTTWYRQS